MFKCAITITVTKYSIYHPQIVSHVFNCKRVRRNMDRLHRRHFQILGAREIRSELPKVISQLINYSVMHDVLITSFYYVHFNSIQILVEKCVLCSKSIPHGWIMLMLDMVNGLWNAILLDIYNISIHLCEVISVNNIL